jgi:hypothetical protein
MSLHRSRLIYPTLCLLALIARPAVAQQPDLLTVQPAQDHMVTGAPYSADHITTVRLTVFGSSVEQKVGSAEFEQRLTNVRRAEPAPDLFTIPPTYTITRVPLPTVR